MVFKTPENRPVGTDVPVPRSLVPSPRRSVLLSGATSRLLASGSTTSPSSDPASQSSNRPASTPNASIAATKKFKPTYANLLQSLKDGGLTGNGARKNMFSSSRLASSTPKPSSTTLSNSTTSLPSTPTTPKSIPTAAALSVFSPSVLKDSTKDTVNKTPNHHNSNNDNILRPSKMDSPSLLGKRSSSVAGLSTPSRNRDTIPSPFLGSTPAQTPSTPQSATKSPPRRSHPQIFGRSMSTTFTRTKSITPTTTSVGLARTVSSGNLHGTKLDIVSNDWKASGGCSPKKNRKIFIQVYTSHYVNEKAM